LNPFKDLNKSDFFTDKVKAQVENMEIGESMQPELFGRCFRSLRMTLNKFAQKNKKKFKTKVATGELWIMRVK
tara:strand:+ start:194 stop:412 length:219 start_codon:yes stop_codon:yes gene_type:complete